MALRKSCLGRIGTFTMSHKLQKLSERHVNFKGIDFFSLFLKKQYAVLTVAIGGHPSIL